MARPARGFTLLEIMIVVAIIGVITALSVTAAQRIGARNATQSAASDVSSLLQNARARAEQAGSDVYVLVYPTMTKAGALTGGSGAMFVYEDANGDFLTGTGACTGAGTADCSWTNFTPPTNIKTPPTSKDKLVQALYLDDYPGKNVRFGKPPVGTLPWKVPFTSLTTSADANGCSFCSASPAKGAVVFTGEQQLRFLSDTGAPVAVRVGGLALRPAANPDADNTFLFGLVGASGSVSVQR